MFHMLSEISCYQRFGDLPPYFWRKGTPCKQAAKDHYQKVYRMLMSWQKKRIPAKGGTWNPLEAMNQVFYYLCTHDREADELMNKQVKLVREEPRKRITDREAIDFGPSKKRSKLQGLKDLGGDDGEGEER